MEQQGLRTYVAWSEDRGTGTRFRVLVDAVDRAEAMAFLEEDGMHVIKMRRRSLLWAQRAVLGMCLLGVVGTLAIMFGNLGQYVPEYETRRAEARSSNEPLWERKPYFESHTYRRPKPRPIPNKVLKQELELRSGSQASADEKTETETKNKNTEDAVDLLDVLGGS